MSSRQKQNTFALWHFGTASIRWLFSLVIFILVVNRIYGAKGGVIEPHSQAASSHTSLLLLFLMTIKKQGCSIVKFNAQIETFLLKACL